MKRSGKQSRVFISGRVGLLAIVAMLAGCSGPGEDVRVTLCKNLTLATLGDGTKVEWQGGENTFRRPEYAVTGLRFEATMVDGTRTTMQSACHYAYDALEDTAQHLADPLSAYDNLPFAMSVDDRMLGDRELLQLVNAEQRRQGRQALDTLGREAQGLADKVRAGIGG